MDLEKPLRLKSTTLQRWSWARAPSESYTLAASRPSQTLWRCWCRSETIFFHVHTFPGWLFFFYAYKYEKRKQHKVFKGPVNNHLIQGFFSLKLRKRIKAFPIILCVDPPHCFKKPEIDPIRQSLTCFWSTPITWYLKWNKTTPTHFALCLPYIFFFNSTILHQASPTLTLFSAHYLHHFMWMMCSKA